MQHCFGVAVAVVDTVGMAKGIVEEGIVGEENLDVETVGYKEIGFLDGSSST